MLRVYPQLTGLENMVSVYIKGIGTQPFQENISRPRGLPYFQFLYTEKGEGLVNIANKEYSLKEGSVFILFPGIAHKYFATSDTWVTHWISIDGNLSYLVFNHFKIKDWSIGDVNDGNKLVKNFFKLKKMAEHNYPASFLEGSARLLLFIIEVCKDMNITNTIRSRRSKTNILDVVDYLEKNYNKDISLDELATLANITPQHLCRSFKSHFHISPISYLTQIRIKQAKDLLIKSPEMSIKQIATSVGYCDFSYFCFIFKELEKVTPAEFRNNFA